MNQKLKKVICLCLIFFLTNSSIFVYSVYQESYYGKGKLQIALPKIRLISNFTYLEFFDENTTYSNEFQVLNYNENDNITEVDLAYKISVKTNFLAAPLDFKLYQLNVDGTQQELDVTNPITFKANVKQKHSYKLTVSYNLSDEFLEENTEVFVELQTYQINQKEAS